MLCGAAITGLTVLMHIFARSMLRTALTSVTYAKKNNISYACNISRMQL